MSIKSLFLVSVFFALCVFALSASAVRFSHDSLIEVVNENQAGWTAGRNLFWDNFDSEAEIVRLLGTELDAEQLPEATRAERGVSETLKTPTEFDSRTQWPNCIGPISNQGSCGSCWAFGGVNAFSDRLCIVTNDYLALAPLDPVTCDQMDAGCEGGNLGSLWNYLKNDGVVTEACAPYNQSIPTCTPDQQPCLKFVGTPRCNKTCEDGSEYKTNKHFAKSAYGIRSVTEVENEIMTNGPVEAAFEVYEDFLTYQSGVYQHTTGNFLGGHAVRILGWGVENGDDYWLIANSWTDSWGDNGYFKMLKGSNECGIEASITAGLPSQN